MSLTNIFYAHWVYFSIHSWSILHSCFSLLFPNPVGRLFLLGFVFGFFGVSAREPASQHFWDVWYCRFIIEGLHLGLHFLIIENNSFLSLHIVYMVIFFHHEPKQTFPLLGELSVSLLFLVHLLSNITCVKTRLAHQISVITKCLICYNNKRQSGYMIINK